MHRLARKAFKNWKGITGNVRGLLNRLMDYERSSGRWPVVAAFFAGMVLTAAVAQNFVYAGSEFPQEKPNDIVPVHEVAPGLSGKFVYIFPAEALITNQAK